MKITVNKDNVKIEEFDVVHEGEHRVNKCSFSFSEEYTEELVKKAIFTSQNSSVEVAIINNECNIPTEILKARNIVLLGVYAYKVVDDKLDLRYSPSPDAFKVNSGSYIEGANESEEITPSQFEQYMQAMNDGLNKVEESIKKMDEATSSATQLVDDINQKLENGDFIGPEGTQGPQGVPGNDGVGITTITSGQSSVEEDKTITPVTVNKTDGSSQIFKVEAKNGLDGQNGQDGLTPSIGQNGNWYLGDTDTGKPSRGEVGPSPDLSDYVKNTDYATATKAGVLKINGNAARISSDGVLSAAEVSEEQYKTTVNSIFISKGTLDNIKNFLVESSTPVITLNNTLDNLVRKNRVSDYIISLKDALKYKVFEFLVHGKTQQKTTTGKNKFDISSLINRTQTIGASTGNIYTLKPNTQYTVSTNMVSSNTDDSIPIIGIPQSINAFIFVSSDTTIEAISSAYNGVGTTNNITRTLMTDDTGNIFVGIRESVSSSLSNLISKGGYVQIEEGSTATSYEPYTGGQPSPSPDYPQEITTLTFDKITRSGKNLLPNNLTSQTINGVSAIVNDDKSITVNGTAEKRTVFYLYSRNTNEIDYILPKGIDFILKSPRLENAGINFQLGLYEPNKTEEYITANGINDRQFKLDNYKIVNYFALIVEEGQTVDLTCYPQLEIGIESTEYEPYQGQTYDIDLQGNEMVELPNGVKDELVIDKYGNVSLIKNVVKKILNGSENWNNASEGNNIDGLSVYINYVSDLYVESGNPNKIFMCDKLRAMLYDDVMLNNPVNFICGGWGEIIIINIARNLLETEDISGVKNWLQEHNVTIYYQAREPQPISLGKLSDIITTLNGTNNISINGNIPTTISTTYALDIKKYIDNKLAEISTAMIEEG